MSDAFQDLERELRRAVRSAGVHGPARRRRWRRTSAMALAAALLVSGGAIAATRVLPIGKPIEELAAPRPDPHAGAGVVRGPVHVLPLRVADPDGGPPWALRVFRSSRGASCVQVGRVYRGRFGLVQAASRVSTSVAFRELRELPGANSLCGGVERESFPVLRGLRRVEIDGGAGDPRRCRSGGKLGSCPIRSVRILRYGLLGPEATRATLVDGPGGHRKSMPIRPGTGGAYLFVMSMDPEPFRRADAARQAAGKAWRAAYVRARRAGVPVDEAGRRGLRAATRVHHQAEPPPSEGVIARFAGGQALKVAGPGRTHGALPGVTRHVGRWSDMRVAIKVKRTGSGARASFSLRFHAPVAIARADRHFTLSVDGPDGRGCTSRIPPGFDATTRDIARGELVTFSLRPTFSGYGRRSWCRGSFTVHVGYRTPSTGSRGRTVGTYRFTVR